MGVTLDSKLTFESHIKILETNLSKAVGIVCELKFVLPKDALIKLYYALFHPNLLYGLVIWRATYPTYLMRISILQNKVVKLVGGGAFQDRVTPFYYKLSIPKLTDLYKIDISKLMYNIVHRPRHLPNNFSKYFEKGCKISKRSTRSTLKKMIFYAFHDFGLTDGKIALGTRASKFGIPFLIQYVCYLQSPLR